MSNEALGPPIDRRTVGWEEFIYRAYSKIWAHFNSDNVYVDRKQEPRYTPSIEVQTILISTFQQVTAGPQLPLNLGRSGKNSSYGGVTFAQPTAIMSSPKNLTLYRPCL